MSAHGVIEVDGGQLRGDEVNGAWRFRGVPFAAAPLGALRFSAPAPPEPWTGVLDADRPGAICPQPPPSPWIFLPGDPVDADEDCLTLNVWTSGFDGAARPVMVWFHGGAFVSGTGAGALYDGAALARRGVVVVTCNYRLGTLGFLTDPALAGADGVTGNWGLLDQLAVLAWARRNAPAFGGDPGNVTVFGQSAGGMSIVALLGSIAALGAFDKAIIQSGPPHVCTSDTAHRRALHLCEHLGIGLSAEALRAVAVDDLVAAQQTVGALERDDAVGFAPPFLPATDGAVVTGEPLHEVAAGRGPDVPLLIGTTTDEASYFAAADPTVGSLDDEGLARLIERAARAGSGRVVDGAAVVSGYRAARGARGEDASPLAVTGAIVTDLVFRQPSDALADARATRSDPTFVYEFTWRSPLFDGAMGACHSVDLPFVFGTLDAPRMGHFAGRGADARALADTVQEAWVAFARSGDPSGTGVGTWPTHDPATRPTMQLGATVGVAHDPRGAERRAWNDATDEPREREEERAGGPTS